MRLNSVPFLAAELVQVVENFFPWKTLIFDPIQIIIIAYSLVTARSHVIDMLLPE